MKRSVLKKSIPLTAVLMMAMLVVGGIAYTVWYTSRDVTTSMTVLAAFGLGIWNEAMEAMTSIDFDGFYRGELKEFPNRTLGEIYTIENTGEGVIYIYYDVSGLPTGSNIRIYHDHDGDATFNIWAPGQWLIDGSVPYPIPSLAAIEFYVTVSVASSTPFGDYTPTIEFFADDQGTTPPP